jgi:hypothetical protein
MELSGVLTGEEVPSPPMGYGPVIGSAPCRPGSSELAARWDPSTGPSEPAMSISIPPIRRVHRPAKHLLVVILLAVALIATAASVGPVGRRPASSALPVTVSSAEQTCIDRQAYGVSGGPYANLERTERTSLLHAAAVCAVEPVAVIAALLADAWTIDMAASVCATAALASSMSAHEIAALDAPPVSLLQRCRPQ